MIAQREDPMACWGPDEDAAVSIAIRRGVEFLARARQSSGGELFREYVRSDGTGGSTEWASAFIVSHVSSVEEAKPLCADTVQQLLRRARPTGGWGYREHVLEDCDSTAWVLLAAARARVPVPRAVRDAAYRFILSHQTPAGGFATYGARGREIFGQVAQREGWFEPQLCVTAAVLLALRAAGLGDTDSAHRAERFVIGERGELGLWRAYWWPGHAYATYHALAALANSSERYAQEALASSAALREARCDDSGWGLTRTGPSTAFLTALSVLAILLARPPGEPASNDIELQSATQRLLEWQQEDGGFAGSAQLIVPGGYTGELHSMTDAGAFTSACVLHALHEVRARYRQVQVEG